MWKKGTDVLLKDHTVKTVHYNQLKKVFKVNVLQKNGACDNFVACADGSVRNCTVIAGCDALVLRVFHWCSTSLLVRTTMNGKQ